MALERGTLVLGKKDNLQINIGGKIFNPAAGEISQTILDRLKEMNGQEVEFERIGGQPKKIREVGGSFVPPRSGVTMSESGKAAPAGRGHNRSGLQQAQQPNRHTGSAPPRDFHNPYNFVLAPPRKADDPDLGDQPPVDQGRFLPDRYSGRIRVRMTVVTPLLVPDTENARGDENGHKTYPLRLDGDGKPRIPASGVRGMLRSAYEAVTNSRFGRFSREQHGNRLAFRMGAREGLHLIPARVENGQIRLLTGTSAIRRDGRPQGPLYAAWLPRYDKQGRVAKTAVRYKDGSLPAHGDEVVCWVEMIQHDNPEFTFWRVREIARGNAFEVLGPQPHASPPNGKTAPAQPSKMRKVHGFVCITNANINRKHDERVFFQVQDPGVVGVPKPFPLNEHHRSLWRELIENYQSIHADDLAKRRARNRCPDQYYGHEPGQTAWSRHVYTQADRELRDGTLCYVRLNQDQTDVDALFPVMISRELYSVAPWDLLPESLRPAATIKELSPADRVFGWVKVDADTEERPQGERVAARGLLRVGPVHCLSSAAESVERFPEPGLPLAILSAPKPQQGRFYVARSPNGEAQADGLSKQKAGYSSGKGLRGRKVYPHHQSLPTSYWENSMADRTQQPADSPTHYQEYRRPKKDGQEQRDDQNRSILSWVKPGATFTFDIQVMNLSAVELGALLWILELPENHHHRFGGGKPFGFGSVRLEIESCDLRIGEKLIERYSAWQDTSPPNDPRAACVEEFKKAVVRAYGSGQECFERVPFITAFLIACRGFSDNLPIHYPRATTDGRHGPPSPDGESFKWFVANERNGAQYALQDLANDGGLPTLSE